MNTDEMVRREIVKGNNIIFPDDPIAKYRRKNRNRMLFIGRILKWTLP